MKKIWVKWVILLTVLLLGIIFTLNIKVTTRQGINYQWSTIDIPLYLKLLDFFDRHYNYKWVTKKIVGDSKTGEEKVLKIFNWTHEIIKRTPENYPVIDDHVWYIIVRGYGENDQSSDVFTTLCNYAGIDAFYNWVYTKNRSSRIPLSFVKIDGGWSVFDPYNGAYFKNKKGNLASLEDIINEDWLPQIEKPEIDYASYFKNLPPVKEIGLVRANIQSPLKRLKYEIRKFTPFDF